jgi:hypothetical protein
MKKLMFYMLLAGAAFAQAAEPGRVKPPLLDIEHILAVLVYSVIGIVVMVVSRSPSSTGFIRVISGARSLTSKTVRWPSSLVV